MEIDRERNPISENVLGILELSICIGNLECLLSFEYHAKSNTRHTMSLYILFKYGSLNIWSVMLRRFITVVLLGLYMF